MLNKSKVAIIIGTRAELIKTFPVMLELQRKKMDYYFIHTGQHNLKDLCKIFGIKSPDIVLSKEPTESSRFNTKQSRAIKWGVGSIFKIRRELKKLKNLKYVLYHGDTLTTAVASIASSKMLNPFKRYKNAHLEAGLRSWNIHEPFPEEISRRIVGRFSDLLFAPSLDSEDNLKKYKKKEVYVFGNTIVDSADYALNLAKKGDVRPLTTGKFALITVHRHENLKSKSRMEGIVNILDSLSVPGFFAVHDNTLLKLKEFGLLERLKDNKNIKIIKPLDYVSFIYQVSKCSLIICDGGSMQEESLIFKKPCIILRYATERPEGLKSNFQFLSGLDVERTREKIKEFLSPNFKVKLFKNPYGEVGLSKKIVGVLR